MANVLGELFQDIADAIRSKTGNTATLKPNQFPSAIEGITTGGGEGEKPFDCHSVTFVYGDKSYVRSVADGDTCADPVARGLIPTPTKESTAQYNYTFYGWGASDGGAADANILKNITEDKTVYAIFTATVRYYTITWLDDDGETVLKTEQVAYGTVPSYTPSKDGFTCTGWDTKPVAVTGDATYTAIWTKNAWTWDLSDGVLTISGAGAMDDYTFTNAESRPPWNSRRTEITSIVIEHGISAIGEKAFYYCTSLTSVTIPDSVTTIGSAAFDSCDSLTSVTIPDSVTTIGAGAFNSCDSLTSVTIPDSVTTIGAGAFSFCNSLTSVTIPDSVTTIGSAAFSYCTSLTSVTIPDSVTTIDSAAFFYCSKLTSVTIPDSVTTIGSAAFDSCDSLTSATFENTSGWYVTKTQGASSGTNVTVTNTSTAATYLKNTYKGYYWYRK